MPEPCRPSNTAPSCEEAGTTTAATPALASSTAHCVPPAGVASVAHSSISISWPLIPPRYSLAYWKVAFVAANSAVWSTVGVLPSVTTPILIGVSVAGLGVPSGSPSAAAVVSEPAVVVSLAESAAVVSEPAAVVSLDESATVVSEPAVVVSLDESASSVLLLHAATASNPTRSTPDTARRRDVDMTVPPNAWSVGRTMSATQLVSGDVTRAEVLIAAPRALTSTSKLIIAADPSSSQLFSRSTSCLRAAQAGRAQPGQISGSRLEQDRLACLTERTVRIVDHRHRLTRSGSTDQAVVLQPDPFADRWAAEADHQIGVHEGP